MPPETYNLGLGPQEKKEQKMTSAELAVDHINLVSEEAERELKEVKSWRRVQETFGGVSVVLGSLGACFFLMNGISPELSNALRNLDLEKLISTEGVLLTATAINLLVGGLNIFSAEKGISEAVEKAKEKKKHILNQYIGRTEAPPQT